MKKKSPPYAIIGAALLGIIAIVAVYKWKQQMDASHQEDLDAQTKKLQQEIDDLKARPNVTVQPTDTNMRNVFYATQPIDAGAQISPAFFEKQPTPNNILPDAYPADSSDIVGFYAIRNIEKGDPLTPHNIAKTLPYLSQRIPPGMRAVSLPIFNAEANDSGGFAVDGDKVDLLMTTSSPDGATKLRTETVMQNVEVLYVPGTKIESDEINGIGPIPPPGLPISITFQVTPEQAQALIFLSQQKTGQFSMILRGRPDKDITKIKPFVGEDYFGNLAKVQKMVVKSDDRVSDLAAKIAAEAKIQNAQGTTNETPNPTPPTP